MRRCGEVVEGIDFEDKSNGINAVGNLGLELQGRATVEVWVL